MPSNRLQRRASDQKVCPSPSAHIMRGPTPVLKDLSKMVMEPLFVPAPDSVRPQRQGHARRLCLRNVDVAAFEITIEAFRTTRTDEPEEVTPQNSK